jgi:OTU domain-containing protein 6
MHGSCVHFGVSLSPWGSGSLCADTLAAHPDDFAPFCEYQNDDSLNDNDNDPYQTYVSNVRTSAEWGGHLELRALAVALHRPILIYQAHTPDPLEITPNSGNGDATPAAAGDEPIRLSYHRHYYALGEHYNQVVLESEEDEAEQVEEEEPQS